MHKIKEWRDEARNKKHLHSDDLERIIRRCRKRYGHLFPEYICTKNGSKSVHHFNVSNLAPISIERPHGSREYIPQRFAAIILNGIDDLINYIEMRSEGETYECDITAAGNNGEDDNPEQEEGG